MPDAAKNEPMTRFLMYKIAIRCDEMSLAAECIHMIATSTNDPKLLYACVLDAQQAGNKSQTLVALQLVLEKCGYEAPSINFASLLRLTITLMVQVLGEAAKAHNVSTSPIAMIDKLCILYEKGEATSGLLECVTDF